MKNLNLIELSNEEMQIIEGGSVTLEKIVTLIKLIVDIVDIPDNNRPFFN